MCVGALATCSNIAKHIKDYNMNCSICGALEDSVTHALLECPLATAIWEASPFPPEVWDMRYSSIFDSLLQVHESWGPDDAADFLAILGELNFNACCLVEWGCSLGFVVRDSLGDVLLAGCLEVTEAEAYLFGIQQALLAGFSSLVIEGDSLLAISKLRKKTEPCSILGFFISEILKIISTSCSYVARNCIKRGGNRVAHEPAHLQPL
ncbi:hypothetical protein Cgig2_002905 [Carnegiea gigantea]|uniref:RNase H type-1 domain-containing protein n=1 Tax=Carnegiea gigantea TaxID=171969 RepID=A0A9Q1JKG9_9CARY|nr:hypothetical protein Cgig2_002905 [Carnegiea gigantea]